MQYRKFSNFQWPYPVENKAIATKNSVCLTATGGQKEKNWLFLAAITFGGQKNS
jgi:hypothetical protein